MRLWHKDIIPYLPKTQLLGLWRELNSIFVNEDEHILINYIYEYNKIHLYRYTICVMNEMVRRGIKIKNPYNFFSYFANEDFIYSKLPLEDLIELEEVFEKHHNDRYLMQCFHNLQEKYDRGQKDFTKEQYEKLLKFICEQEKGE